MREKNHSKSGLFLIELMIAVLFFSIAAAVCMQAFVKSAQISDRAQDLSQAQTLASSVAELLSGDGEDGSPADVLTAYYPQLAAASADEVAGYFDEDWEPSAQEEARRLIVSWEEADGMENVIISIQKDEKEIYRLPLALYRGSGTASQGGDS